MAAPPIPRLVDDAPSAQRLLAAVTRRLLTPRPQQLLHDDSEAFLVDGEALLFEALCGTACAGRVSVGQPLQMLYWTESLLEPLLSRGARIAVSFCPAAFDAAWALDAGAAVMRTLLRRHLVALARRSCGTLEVVTAGADAAQWDQVLAKLQPHFVMVSDAALLTTASHIGTGAAADGAAGAAECTPYVVATSLTAAAEEAVRQRLQAAVWRALLSKMPVAFLGQLRVDSHSASGFLQGYDPLHRTIIGQQQLLSAAVQAVLFEQAPMPPAGAAQQGKAVDSAAAGVQLPTPAAHLETCLQRLRQAEGTEPPSWRLALAAAATHAVRTARATVLPPEDGAALNSKTVAWLGDLWVLHAALLDAGELPLEERALPSLAALAGCGDAAGSAAAAQLAEQLVAPFQGALLGQLLPLLEAVPRTETGAACSANGAGGAGEAPAAISAAMADLFDTHMFEMLVLLWLQPTGTDGSPSGWQRFVSALPPHVASRVAAALPQSLACDAPGPQIVTLQPPQDVAQAWGPLAAAALEAAALLRRRHRATLSRLTTEAREQRQWLASLDSAGGLVPTIRAALADPAGPAGTYESQSSTTMWDGNAASAAQRTVRPPHFGVRPWTEVYHWHIPQDLKPYFLLESKSDSQDMESQKQALASMPPEALMKYNFRRHILPANQEALQQLLFASKAEVDPVRRDQLLNTALAMANDALSHWASRQKQFAARAMARLVNSLSGQTFHSAHESRMDPLALLAATAAPLATTGAGAAAGKAAGGKGKTSGKAALLKEANALRLLGDKSAAEQLRWQAAQLKVVQAALAAAQPAALARAAEAADAFVRSCTTPAAAASGVCAKLVVVHAWLSAVSKARAPPPPPPPPSGPVDPAMATRGGVVAVALPQASQGGRTAHLSLPPLLATPVRAMLLTLGQVLQLPDTYQAAPAPLPQAGAEPVSPLKVAAAAAAALGFCTLGSALLGRLAWLKGGGGGAAPPNGAALKPPTAKGTKAAEAARAAKSAPAAPTKAAKAGNAGKGGEGKAQRLRLRPVLLAAPGADGGVGGGADGGAALSAERLQLALLPDLLPREVLSSRDPRVRFVPDDWQRKLLDAVDAGASAVVCAPTSSGKTFISSYIIEQVLASGSTGVVVIVLPTKALVNQVAAQVYADFGGLDANVHGVFTRDFRYNELTCRVLITVPACLEILLLSPIHRDWVASIRAAIFDEVHCLNEASGGDTWERLLLLTRCPLLALSATIGNPEDFVGWLRRIKALQRAQDRQAGTQAKSGAYEVELIIHTERHNDLLFHTFFPALPPPPGGAAAAPPSCALEPAAPGTGTGVEFVGDEEELQVDEEELQVVQGHRDLADTWAAGPVWTTPGSSATPGGLGASAAAAAAATSAAAAATAGPVGALLPLHPAACVSPEQLSESGWPLGLSVAPNEALQLYDAMRDAAGAAFASSPMPPAAQAWLRRAQQQVAALAPEMLTASPPPIRAAGSAAASASQPPPLPQHALARLLVTRQRAKAWAAQLVALLVGWVRAGEGEPGAELAADVLRRLRGHVEATEAAHEEGWAAVRPLEPVRGVQYQISGLMQLLTTLHGRGMLPGILFLFSRGLCEVYAEQVCHALEVAEQTYRRRYAPQLAALRKGAAAAAAAQEAAAARAEAAAKRKGGRKTGGGDAEGAGGVGEGDGAVGGGAASTFVVDGIVFSADEALPDPSFTFLPVDKARGESLMEAVEELRDAGTAEVLVSMLLRGVAVHHSGLDKRYRQAVETLFRSKHLQVVAATGTLAYGIHMPCRAVVMCGESTFLDVLNYQQMSGRSGRRGLDSVGHVVHYALPLTRVCELRVAKLPRLRGHFLLDSSLLLRMLVLSQQLQDAGAVAQLGDGGGECTGGVRRKTGDGEAALARARGALLALVQAPFLEGSEPRLAAQQRLAMDFAVAYLRAANLVDASCRPVALAGLATHLFWTAPAQMALVRFLSTGTFHDALTSCPAAGRSEALLRIMAHLFLRQPLHPLAVQHWRVHKHTSPSEVVLPELPPLAQEVLRDHHASTQQLLLTTLASHAAQRTAAQGVRDATLPLSRITFFTRSGGGCGGRSGGDNGGAGVDNSAAVCAPLAALACPFLVASPFMALCGRADEYSSLQELLTCLPPSLQLPSSCLPVLSTTDARGCPLALNAFLVDYFRHRQKRALVRDNGLREGDAWQLLSSANGVIAATANALHACVDAETAVSGAYGDDEADAGGVSSADVAAAFERLSAAFRGAFDVYNGAKARRW